MSMETEEFSGRIIIDSFDVLFTISGFEVTFLNPDFSKIYDENNFYIKPDDNGFVFGETYDRIQIAIYIRERILLTTVVKLKTWIYIVYNSKTNVGCNKGFYGIDFCGGTINTLFPESLLTKDFNGSNEDRIVLTKNLKNDLHYVMNRDEIKGYLHLFSTIKEKHSLSNGTEIIHAGTHLELGFNEFMELKEFEHMYRSIVTLCQFMAFRKNVGFDNVYLLGKDMKIVASCYINGGEDRTNKHTMRCITFRDLGECVVNLLESILEDTQDEPSYCVNFLPKNDEDIMYIDNAKLRDICSAIECEMDIIPINAASDKNFDELIKDVKNLIKEHRSGENPLKNQKTYDFIFGNIRHWNPALADRIYETYSLHKEEMDRFMINVKHPITKEGIQELVNYRNTITHGSYRKADDKIFYTAVAIGALVYCCVLERVGVSKERIKDLMERGITIK